MKTPLLLAALTLVACSAPPKTGTVAQSGGVGDDSTGGDDTGRDPSDFDVTKLGEDCSADDACSVGLSCVTYYGIAGASGPEFKSCEVACSDDPAACPDGTDCLTIADGPGQVCRPPS